ncbi:DUF333 domain-containing protein [Candidatus Peregrinibacteria bacterium]|nr:MAG: DUF333 domain-containing protein [Candidatus Peregrinibacteria bacterium]
MILNSQKCILIGMSLSLLLFLPGCTEQKEAPVRTTTGQEKNMRKDVLSEKRDVPEKRVVSRGDSCNLQQNIVCETGLECTNSYCASEPTIAKEPATEYCRENGGYIDVRRDERGADWRYCVFEDSSECEEQAFFTKECQQGDSLQETVVLNEEGQALEIGAPNTPPPPAIDVSGEIEMSNEEILSEDQGAPNAPSKAASDKALPQDSPETNTP